MKTKLFQVRAFINTHNKKKGYTMVWNEEYTYVDLESALEGFKTIESRMNFNGSCHTNASGYCRLFSTELNENSKGKLSFDYTLSETKY
jgi:hypothetical protein